ncbi:putative Late embryogenesis abundant protein, SMP subgroup [Helianthus annuus]|uniref:Late embryogenesis abundant protein, SMP subgroup n=2 Tax=Helianthus annuus TaxID=4232 RepID=A0A251UJ04_HELAN|nr:putative Late embryogenesis abundant protein, SMP subgroup [Helianthus annuus]KAJ0565617.1 putative Late embryogenesis abundant protein, SMP subgroup [Helianthus annuus]KAJ0910716.1 putative Late embryogenesis abundant protein, SMP subgroup [Helianthus annuus]
MFPRIICLSVSLGLKMSQEQPIKYGDVFQVSGELANKAITPEDAATMQSAENMVLGHTHKGGPAAVMQSAASVNRNRGLHQVTGDQQVTVSDAEVAGQHIITEAVGGQVVGQYVHPTSAPVSLKSGGEDLVTIGEALEAAGLSAAEKPVEQSDAAAIQAAEVRATGRMEVMPGGVAAKAQGAASQNARTMCDEKKTKLGDVLTDASSLLPEDKVVTRVDAEGVIGAEIRNQPEMATYPGGVAASMAAAARLNQNK